MADDAPIRATGPEASTRAIRRGSLTGGTLQLAAQALAEVSPTAGTVQDVLEGHVLGHYAEGLRQYLAIRLGDVDAARGLFARLRDEVARLGVGELAAPPGLRARVYRLARELVLARDEGKAGEVGDSSEAPPGAPPPPGSGTLPWFRPRSSRARLPQIEMLRARASEDRELLELRHARGLEVPEVAYVVGRPEAEVADRLAAAEAEAKVALARGGSVDLPATALHAFSLERDPSIQAERESDVEPLVLPGVVIDGRYELEKHVGSGGFADVYRARDIAVPGHVVALKLLKRKAADDAARDHALRELRLIAAVFHPSIVQFKDHGWYEDRFWFVMPWYDGESLETRIEREPLDRAEARRVFEPLARALATMHASGIRHQDVKPDNIFLANLKGFGAEVRGKRGQGKRVLPVLIDLGVAATDAELVLAGTPTYFAPEVAAQFAYREGEPFPEYPIGPAADVFALALSLRNALDPLTQPDVIGGNVDAFIRERAQATPEPPTTKELRYLRGHFQRWLALDPAKRPTADELADELAVLTLPEERRERRLRVLRVFGPIVLALLTVFGVVAWELSQRAKVQAEKAERLELERARATAERDEAEAQAEELAAAVSEARRDIESASLSRAELEQRLVAAEAQARVSENALARARRQLSEAEKASEVLRTSLGETQAAQRRAEAQREEQRALVATRERELSDARTARAALEGSLGAAERARDDARAALAGVEQRVQAAERARDEARAALTTIDQRVQAAERARDQASQEAQRLERDLASARTRITELERQLAAASRPAAMVVAPPATEEPPATEPDRAPTVMVRRTR